MRPSPSTEPVARAERRPRRRGRARTRAPRRRAASTRTARDGPSRGPPTNEHPAPVGHRRARRARSRTARRDPPLRRGTRRRCRAARATRAPPRAAPGASGSATRCPSCRSGCSVPSSVSVVSSAPAGSVTKCWPPWLLRRLSVSETSVARRPGASPSWLRSIVSVSPPAPAGRSIASASFSPGQGRHSRRRVPCAGASTAGMPSAVTCQSGLGSRRQTSVHATARGASSASAGRSRATLLPGCARSRPARASRARGRPATRTPALVTDSPARSGTSSTIAPSGGATRTTSVVTSQREAERERALDAARTAGSRWARGGALRACPRRGAASRASWSAPGTRPAASRPSTVQPRGAPISSTRCGRRGSGISTVARAGSGPASVHGVAARRERAARAGPRRRGAPPRRRGRRRRSCRA